MMPGTWWILQKVGPMTRLCKDGNETLDSLKGKWLVSWLTSYLGG